MTPHFLKHVSKYVLSGLGLIFLFSLGPFLGSCATSREERRLRHFLMYNLHVRRPKAEGADPSAEKGEHGFESHPKPNSQFDCLPVRDLFQGFNLPALRQCLKSTLKTHPSEILTFRVMREKAPYLKLDKVSNDPPLPLCIKNSLATLPVPREIFFQSKEASQLACYNSRLALKDDEFFGFLDSVFPYVVIVELSNVKAPDTDEEMAMLLSMWATLPFFHDEAMDIASKVVPNAICEQCMGEKNLFRDQDPLPPHWP